MKRAERELVESVGDATLEDLQRRFPQEWSAVGAALVAAAETKRPEAMVAFMRRFQEKAKPWRARVETRRAGSAAVKAALPHLAMARMARLAVQQTLQATAARVATGGTAVGHLRFRRWSGWLVQQLFFARGLRRKPVSMKAFRWLWPLVTQRRILMPLVTPLGMYCFYSRELILALAERIGERSCLELAAGDGTLARFLSAAGTTVIATDDRSWSHAISYPDDVEALEATEALRRYRPSVVLCSFPPPNNTFERAVFESASVDLYVVVTTRHRFAAGDWDGYARQTRFERSDEKSLARLVLPPEIDPAVLVFRRSGV